MNAEPSSSPLSHLSLWMSPIPHQGLASTSYGGDAHDVHVLRGFSSSVHLPHPCFACDVRGSLFYGGFLHHCTHLRRTSYHGPVYSFVLPLHGFYLTWKSRWIPEQFWRRPNKRSPLITQPNRTTGSTGVPGPDLQHRLAELDFSPGFLANLGWIHFKHVFPFSSFLPKDPCPWCSRHGSPHQWQQIPERTKRMRMKRSPSQYWEWEWKVHLRGKWQCYVTRLKMKGPPSQYLRQASPLLQSPLSALVTPSFLHHLKLEQLEKKNEKQDQKKNPAWSPWFPPQKFQEWNAEWKKR